MEKQVSLLSRVVQFDRTFDARSENGLVVGVVFQAVYPPSVQEKDAFRSAVDRISFRDAQNRPVEIVEIDAGGNLGENLDNAEVDILYVSRLQDVDLRQLTEVTRARGILTFSSQARYVEQGLAVALEPSSSDQPILINLTAVDSEGSDFRPGLLKMANVIQRMP